MEFAPSTVCNGEFSARQKRGFWCVLNRFRPLPKASGLFIASKLHPRCGTTPMSNESKILIVAAEPHDRHAVARVLGAEPYEIIEADGIATALAHVDDSVDVVISDLHLPSSNGVELVQKWHELSPTTPFILVAETGDTASAVDAMKHGASDYITKPVNSEELSVRIVKWLDASRQAQRLHQLESRLDSHNGEDFGDHPHIDIPTGTSLEDLERAAVEKALQQHHGNRTHAAKTLGISVRTLQRKLKAWRVPVLSLRHHAPSQDFSFPFAH
jgi:DNA-binding NtrC family response regulator